MKREILTHLPGDFPWQVHWYDTLPSTNDMAKELAKQSAPHGTVVLADSQTMGRGRMGRSFHSPAGHGIYLSLLLRPGCHAQELMHLTCAVAVAMCDAVESLCHFRPGIKWINDLVATNKKLGGILTELSLDADGTVAYCVIGIGINCNNAPLPPELADIATSLEAVTGSTVDRATLVGAMLTALLDMEAKLLRQKTQIMDRYRRDCVTLGREVIVIRQNRKLPAIALQVDDSGGLLVRFADGGTETVSAGEVSLRGMYGYQ